MHFEIDRYARGDSWIHRWDPRWKIVGFASLIVAFAVVGEGVRFDPDPRRDLPPALLALALSISLVQLARIPFRPVLRTLRPALLFFCFLFVVLPFSQRDGVQLVGSMTFSSRGLLAATTLFVRALAIVLLVFPMLGTSRFDETVSALRSLRVPAPLVHLIAFAYRYLFVLGGEVRRMHIAQCARGFRRRLDAHTMRTMGGTVGMLLVGSLERSQRIHHAMACRGYDGRIHTLAERATRASDVAKAAAFAAVAALACAWRWW